MAETLETTRGTSVNANNIYDECRGLGVAGTRKRTPVVRYEVYERHVGGSGTTTIGTGSVCSWGQRGIFLTVSSTLSSCRLIMSISSSFKPSSPIARIISMVLSFDLSTSVLPGIAR